MGEEDALLADVVRVARDLGWLAYHTRDSRRSEAGFPDLTLVRGDRVAFRELKSPKGYLTPEQALWAEALEASCADFAVWRPADWASGEIQRDLRKGAPAVAPSPETARRIQAARIRRHGRRLAQRGMMLAPRIPPRG